MAAPNPIVQSIIAGARARNLDPNAVLAVSGAEGLSGGIGDGGHAFGPFQLNNAGGVITGKFQGETPQQIQQWAESPAGINYALDGIAKVAAGLHGGQAVNAIVSRFERPQNPAGEVKRASALYGAIPAAAAPPSAPAAPFAVGSTLHARAAAPAPPASFPGAPSPIAAALGLLGFDTPAGFGTPTMAAPKFTAPAAPVRPPAPAAPAAVAGAPPPPAPAIKVQGNAAGLKPHLLTAVTEAAKAAGATEIRITSGARSATHNAQVGGVQHSNHLTGDAIDGYGLVNGQWVPLGQLLLKTAGRYGLRSGDVPGFWNGGTDPVHVDDGANQR